MSVLAFCLYFSSDENYYKISVKFPMELAKLYTVEYVCVCVCVKWFISIYVVQLVAVARKLELVPSIFTSNESFVD